MRIHVFCSDFLPHADGAVSGGGWRSAQIIDLYRQMGHEVTYSIPTYVGNRLPPSERGKHHFYRPDSSDQIAALLTRRAEAAVFCYPPVCQLDRAATSSLGIRVFFDVHGPTYVEDAVNLDGRVAKAFNRFSERLGLGDGITCANERQRGMVLAVLSCLDRATDLPWVEVLPLRFETGMQARELSTAPMLLHAGFFHPWQNPDDGLKIVAAHLAERGSGTLVVAGPHYSNSPSVAALISELRSLPSVRFVGALPRGELEKYYRQTWYCVELMQRNVERTLAFTTRTWEQLSCGIPIIYNNYSYLSELIEQHDAGLVVDPKDNKAVKDAVDIALSDSASARTKGSNALRMVAQSNATCEAAQSRIKAQIDAYSRRGPCSTTYTNQDGRQSTRKVDSPPKVLVIAHDTRAILDLRINGPLTFLSQAGLIEGYCVIDGLGGILGPNVFCEYDACIVLREPTALQYRCVQDLAIPYVLDVDDLYTAVPKYSMMKGAGDLIREVVKAADCVTSPSEILCHRLEAHSGINIRSKFIYVPNGLDFDDRRSFGAFPPRAILWVSSDFSSLQASREAVVGAVADFAAAKRLPVFLFGIFDQDLRKAFALRRDFGFMPFWQHKKFLSDHRGFIGIAPLEQDCDQKTLEYIESKSDLKMVEFGGFGHSAAYSDVLPYRQSDLRSGILTENTYSGWFAALEAAYRHSGSDDNTNVRYIRETRSLANLAPKGRYESILAVASSRAVSHSQLEETLQKLRSGAIS